MKLKIVTLSLIVFINISKVQAQQDTAKSLVDTIQYFKSNERYLLNSKKLSITKLGPILSRYNSSKVEFKEYKKRATPGTITILTGVTAGIIAFTKMKKDTHLFTPYTITLIVGDLIGVPLMISANKHLKKSVKLYNKDILK